MTIYFELTFVYKKQRLFFMIRIGSLNIYKPKESRHYKYIKKN